MDGIEFSMLDILLVSVFVGFLVGGGGSAVGLLIILLFDWLKETFGR